MGSGSGKTVQETAFTREDEAHLIVNADNLYQLPG
jgi:hypothetical protein